MQRVTRSTAAPSLPSPPASPGPPGYFTGGDPVSNVPATVPGYEWFNGVQEELVAPVLRAGITLDPNVLDQVRRANDRLYGGGMRSVAANTTLTADDAGVVLVDASGGACTITLPLAAAMNARPIPLRIIRTDSSANAVTIQRAGSDTIENVISAELPIGGRIMLFSDGVSTWRIAGGAGLRRVEYIMTSQSITVPAFARAAFVQCFGGGAGGGTSPGGGGGGAGGVALGMVSVTPGQTITVTIGAGGAGGGGGGTSSFGAFMSATGGISPGAGYQGAVGGAGSGGSLALLGGAGSPGLGSVGGQVSGGAGGSNAYGGGGVGGAFATSGSNGGLGGGGGGGAGSAGTSPGPGGSGLVVVEWLT